MRVVRVSGRVTIVVADGFMIAAYHFHSEMITSITFDFRAGPSLIVNSNDCNNVIIADKWCSRQFTKCHSMLVIDTLPSVSPSGRRGITQCTLSEMASIIEFINRNMY